jgi:hypothetical protein
MVSPHRIVHSCQETLVIEVQSQTARTKSYHKTGVPGDLEPSSQHRK